MRREERRHEKRMAIEKVKELELEEMKKLMQDEKPNEKDI